MSDKRLPARVFTALGIAAAWFFVYVIAHEAITPIIQHQRGQDRDGPDIAPPGSEGAPPPQIAAAIEQIYSDGAISFRKCVICHDEGTDQARFGPPIGYIVSQPVAGKESGNAHDYRYSRTLLEMKKAGLTWRIDALWAFIHHPAEFAPGTRMPFPGIEGNHHEIRALIQYLAWDCGTPCEAPAIVELNLASLQTKAQDWRDLPDLECLDEGEISALTHEQIMTRPQLLIVPEDLVNCAGRE